MIHSHFQQSSLIYFLLYILTSCIPLNTNCIPSDATCSTVGRLLLGSNFSTQKVWVAVGAGVVIYSTDNGDTWSLSNTTISGTIRNVISNGSDRWVLSEDGAPSKFYYSDDSGKNWIPATDNGGLNTSIYAMGYFNNRWWASDSSGNLAYSYDGQKWTILKNFPGAFIEAIHGYKDTLMLVGDSGFNAFSSNLITWTINTPTSGNDLVGLDFNDAGQVVATGWSAPEALTSDDFGVTWQMANTIGIDFFESIYIGNQIFAIENFGLNMYTSLDRLNFTVVTTNNANPLQTLDSLDQTIIIAGANGSIRKSDDVGKSWTQTTAITAIPINRIRGANIYYQKPIWFY